MAIMGLLMTSKNTSETGFIKNPLTESYANEHDWPIHYYRHQTKQVLY